MPPLISIVIPVYNSAACLFKLHAEIAVSLQELSFELILVNDCSKDKSWEVIGAICKSDDRVTGVSLRRNSGQDSAILAGLNFVKGEYVVIMDDDLQHSPRDIPALYQACRNGFDICFANFRDKKQPAWKNLGSWLNGKLAERIIDKPPGIYLSPYKIFRSALTRDITAYSGPYPYIDALLLSVTGNITQIEVTHHQRLEGKSNFNLNKSASLFFKHLITYSAYPLRITLALGIITSLVCLVFALTYFIGIYKQPSHINTLKGVAILIGFFTGLVMICLGLFAEYLGRILQTVNHRPAFTIDRIINRADGQ
jgi:glycosyltransferase involved in cell wall biosynthesis